MPIIKKEFSKRTSTAHCSPQERWGCRRYRGVGGKEKGVSATPNSYPPRFNGIALNYNKIKDIYITK